MKNIPTHQEILTILGTYNFDIALCVDYFIETLNFEGVVIFRDKPGFELASHYHPSDNFVYMVEGILTIEMEGQKYNYQKGDLVIIPKGVIHAVLPSQGDKYLVAVENGDFETIFV